MSPATDQAKTETASAWILLVSLASSKDMALILVKTVSAYGSFGGEGIYPKLTTQFLPLVHTKYHNERQVHSNVALLEPQPQESLGV